MCNDACNDERCITNRLDRRMTRRRRRDLLERISYVFGIHKALLILFGSQPRAAAWLRKPNKAQPFNGRSAHDRLFGGSVTDLAAVREYLDAARG